MFSLLLKPKLYAFAYFNPLNISGSKYDPEDKHTKNLLSKCLVPRRTVFCNSANLSTSFFSRGISLLQKMVREFFRAKGFLRILMDFLSEAKEYLPKLCEIIWGDKAPRFSQL